MKSAALLSGLLLVSIFAPTVVAQAPARVLFSLAEPESGRCGAPLPVTDFALTEPHIYLWFIIGDGRAGDRFRAVWIAADGKQFAVDDWAPVSSAGSWCFWASIDPATSNIPPSKAGDWRVDIYRNNVQVHSAAFRLVESPRPSVSQVMNAASYQGLLAPNTWMTILGAYLTPKTRTWQESDFTGNMMPTALDGVSVTVNGKSAYVSYISPTHINFLTPPDMLPADFSNGPFSTIPLEVQVTNANGTSVAFQAAAHADSFAFFTFDGTHVAGTHLDGSLIGPPGLYPGLSRPAKPGDTLVLYGTGFGQTSPPAIAGAATQAGTIPHPRITVNGVPAFVQFAGAISPGLYQFNVVVPAVAQNGENVLIARLDPPTQGIGTVSKAAYLTVDGAMPILSSMSLATSSIASGQSTTGQITLTEPAPAGGLSVQLSSTSENVRPPAIVRIEAGLRTGSFTVATDVVTTEQTATITATLNGTQRQAQLTLRPSIPVSFFRDYEFRIEGTANVSGRQTNLAITSSVPNLLPYGLLDTTPSVLTGAPLIYVFFADPTISGNTVTFTGITTGSWGLQRAISGKLTITADSPNIGTRATGTIQLSTTSQSLNTTFTGVIVSSQRVSF